MTATKNIPLTLRHTPDEEAVNGSKGRIAFLAGAVLMKINGPRRGDSWFEYWQGGKVDQLDWKAHCCSSAVKGEH